MSPLIGLYLFESCITFSQEAEVIWQRKWSLMTWTYAITRYGSLLLNVVEVIPAWTLEVCELIVSLRPTAHESQGYAFYIQHLDCSIADIES